MYNTNTDIWLSGAFAVLIVDFLVYPIDTLKTRIQSPNYTKVYKNATTGAIDRKLLFRGLYQGVGSVVLATIPASGAFFTTYEGLKHTLSTNPHTQSLLPTPIIHSLSSCIAESVSCFILTPAEVIKQNAQVYTNPTPHSSHLKGKSTPSKTNITLLTLQKFRHRPASLWSGYTALLGRNLPFTGLNFPVFEYLRGHLSGYLLRRRQRGGNGDSDGGDVLAQFGAVQRALITGVSAAVAGTVSSVVTTPVDVVKTRMMLGAGSTTTSSGSGGDRGGRKGAWAVGKKVFREEGVRGLFKGGAIRSVWTAVSFGVYLCVYEGGRGFLENRRKEREVSS
ncbi:hypothetical protein ASPBRDRAFT_524119 [Aspergillus brasiliensis CBS 101740]|uniref:Mitochondrial thiamine pyrophosphate carrier 1 n=1 Tax=Aspergillus brasiliensis (strain CBS 101740 / IMI 381727 / IBT 21946) TaxID=767769 RepID=A0A1L9UQH5_ASPBC|nr:hypothetical protein ASPBRDRAFT_524119 [Aspergillus brasiliensis CBS 101740]